MSGFGKVFPAFGGSKAAPVSLAPSVVPAPPIAPPVATSPSSPTPWVDWPTPWMDWMRSNIGQPEVTGDQATAFDILVFSHTSDDEVSKYGKMAAGCAATACAALELTGYKSPHNAAAISFKSYGSQCTLRPGCVVVFEWANGEHHVTFADKVHLDGTVDCLGGNQSHKLQVSTFSQKYIIATRWPSKA